MRPEARLALCAVRGTLPAAVPLALSILQARAGTGGPVWPLAHVGLVAVGSLRLPPGAFGVLLGATAFSAASPLLYLPSPALAVARVLPVCVLVAVTVALLRPLRSALLATRRRKLETTSGFAVSMSPRREGVAELGEAGIRQLGMDPQARSERMRANGRFMASRAERTAATARSPRDSAEPT